MTDRDRLIELFKKIEYKPFPDAATKYNLSHQFTDYALESIIDCIIASGVIVPPCKIGDTVYCIEFAEDIGIDKGKVYAISCSDTEWFSVRYESGLRYDHPKRVFNKTVFLSYKEAEKALKEREGNG